MGNNMLRFYLEMKDMMSSGLVKVAKQANQSFTQIQNVAKKAQENINAIAISNKKLAYSFDELKAKKEQLEKVMSSERSLGVIRRARAEYEALGRQMNRHAGNTSTGNRTGGGVGNLLGLGMRHFAPAAMLAGAMALGTGSVKAAMNYEATQASYSVLTGSKSKGKELSGNLQTLQQNTILGPEVFKAGQTLMGFGVAAERVVPIIKQLGDVAMGNKDKFESLTLAFAQTQAAGRLMGQDLLQYINAGFNPLQTMSEKWEQFGFKQKVSVGQLKEAMEKGAISSQMVSKAFEIATNSGGKFANMMDTIAQTNFGKLQVLEGQWESFKINLGGKFASLTTGALSAASGILGLVNPLEKASNAAFVEKLKINGLINSIATLNDNNVLRKEKINELVSNYPELFKNLDAETLSNQKLLSVLNNINKAYDEKIDLAAKSEIVADHKKNESLLKEKIGRYSLASELFKQGRSDLAMAQFDAMEKGKYRFKFGWENLKDGNGILNDSNFFKHLNTEIADLKSQLNSLSPQITNSEFDKNKLETKVIAEEAKALYKSIDKQKEIFGGNKNSLNDFLSEYNKFSSLLFNPYKIADKGLDINTLKAKMSPSSITSGSNSSNSAAITALSDKTANSVASGGPRIININGLKFMDKMENHFTGGITENADTIEEKFTNLLLRVLNSGAAVAS